MVFYDENKTPVSSELDCMYVQVDDEADYCRAMEKILGDSCDYEIDYKGPGFYLPDDVMICGEIYLTLTKLSEVIKRERAEIEEHERKLLSSRDRLNYYNELNDQWEGIAYEYLPG